MSSERGLSIERAGTEEAYFAHDGEALLSFGGLSDFTFYAAKDAFDYELWADWAGAHGINHVRTYPPMGWKYVEEFAAENGGDVGNVLFPFEEVGERTFDLDSFDPDYWERFRRKCEYFAERGIVVHLLMYNGWQLTRTTEQNWQTHFFNPENNVNGYTDHLADDRLAFYYAVAEGHEALADAQAAYLRKLVAETADLGNVYYDVVHELTEGWTHEVDGAWPKVRAWLEEMVGAIREEHAESAPTGECIVGTDTGGMSDEHRRWVFDAPIFDVAIFGKRHTVDQAIEWRREFEKPYVGQECWDDSDDKYSYREPNQRPHLRKYFWKFAMTKCQQMDCYVKPRTESQSPNVGVDDPPGNPHNYDPRGWNAFEEDALVLRDFFDSLIDYPNLWFDGAVASAPVVAQVRRHTHVLSSEREAVGYVSSGTAREDVRFPAGDLDLEHLATVDGIYDADVVDPVEGVVDERAVEVVGGAASVALSAFSDDVAVHLY